MKKIFIILIIFFSLFFASNILAFTPNFYVGDGVHGVLPQCQTPNYDTITKALENIYDNNISNSVITVCEGTYNEDIRLFSNLKISIIGENNNVIIQGVNNETSPVSLFIVYNFYLKNLFINTNSDLVIAAVQSNNITLENIENNIKKTSTTD
jgi:hypothetical protein